MIIELGIVSGKIWQYLEKNHQVALSKLIADIAGDEKLVLMGLGWMAREGHAVLEKENGEYKVSLREQKS